MAIFYQRYVPCGTEILHDIELTVVRLRYAKLQPSLIFGSKSNAPRLDDYDGNDQIYPMYIEDLPTAKHAGCNDNNPFELPNITAGQFRSFLLVALGLLVALFSLSIITDTDMDDGSGQTTKNTWSS